VAGEFVSLMYSFVHDDKNNLCSLVKERMEDGIRVYIYYPVFELHVVE